MLQLIRIQLHRSAGTTKQQLNACSSDQIRKVLQLLQAHVDKQPPSIEATRIVRILDQQAACFANRPGLQCLWQQVRTQTLSLRTDSSSSSN
jgi:hypothetical protein